MSTLPKILFALVLAGGALGAPACAPSTVAVSAKVTPRLVWVPPGLWVLEDYPYAVYYVDGFYWKLVDGIWHRSVYYDVDYVRVDINLVPRTVVGSYRPTHVHYRAPAHSQVRPIVRDHRSPPRR